MESFKVTKKAQIDPVSDIVGLGKGIFSTGVAYQRKIRCEWESDESIP